jgi:hypothetical protein
MKDSIELGREIVKLLGACSSETSFAAIEIAKILIGEQKLSELSAKSAEPSQ